MKHENFNLNINALDDKAIYIELCKKIKETNDVSFKLLGYVPLVSGGVVIVLLFYLKELSYLVLSGIGIFGAIVSFCIYGWEMRNIQVNKAYKEYARIIETRKKQQELQKDIPPEPNDGPYNLLISVDEPVVMGKITWGRKDAEKLVFLVVIAFWLMLPVMKWIT